MKFVLTLSLLFFVYNYGLAQPDTSAVLNAVIKMRASLVKKDSNALKTLLHPAIAFGHSNGWVQNKRDVLKDMSSGYLVYLSMDAQTTEISISNEYATVKERIAVEGTRDGNNFKLNLFVLHLWVKSGREWQLLSRQSTKL